MEISSKTKKEIIKFDRLGLSNRWQQRKHSRTCNWTIIGISEWWFGPQDFCYKICFFGIDLHIWFKREWI
jgi:hypothetical protein